MNGPCIHYRSKGGAGRGVGEIKPGSAICREFLRQRRLFCMECNALGPPQKPRPESFDVPPVKTVAAILAQAEPDGEAGLAEEHGPPPVEEKTNMNIAENESIGQAIREARQGKKLTAKETAAMIGVSANCFYVWENGLGKPVYASALKLDKVLGLELVKKYGAGLIGHPKGLGSVDDSAQKPDKSVQMAAADTVADEADSVRADEIGQSCPTLAQDRSPVEEKQPANSGDKSTFANLPDDQVIRVLSTIADTLMTIAGGLSQIIKTLREVRK